VSSAPLNAVRTGLPLPRTLTIAPVPSGRASITVRLKRWVFGHTSSAPLPCAANLSIASCQAGASSPPNAKTSSTAHGRCGRRAADPHLPR